MSAPVATIDLARWRAELPLVERTNHLVNHSLGPMPRAAADELAAFAREWRERGMRAWGEGWWETPVTTGDLLAPILGVAPGTVAMHANVSIAMAVFLSALERLLAAIDERTRLVAVSHVLFKSGYRLDAQAIAERCREAGALLLLDVYQSAGVLPVELARWGVDAAVGGSVKWLCGGPGAGYLYVDPELAERLEPAVTGWQADAEPFEFRPGPIRHARGAWRFLTGTPAVAPLYACRPGYRMIAEVGVEAIRARSIELTGRLIARADARGLEVRSPRDAAARGGSVTVFHPDGGRLCRELAAEEILCDHRPGSGLRFGPHFFNTVEEVEHAIDRLAELAERTSE